MGAAIGVGVVHCHFSVEATELDVDVEGARGVGGSTNETTRLRDQQSQSSLKFATEILSLHFPHEIRANPP